MKTRDILVGLALVGLLVVHPARCSAQTPTRWHAGGGAVSGLDDWGGQVALGASHGDRVRIRSDVFLGVAERRLAGGAVLVGADAVVLFRTGTGGTGPYFGAGPGYTWTDESREMPLAHDLGVTFLAGIERSAGGRTWYFEVKPRFFGNVFYERAVTRTAIFLTVGRTW